MARLLYVVAHSTDAPERAATALAAAAAASEAGHDVSLWLTDEGVRFGVEGLADVLGPRAAGAPAASMAVLGKKGARLHCAAPDLLRLGFGPEVLQENARAANLADLGALVADGWLAIPT